ncbi:hypothetical protein Bca101_039389 [Brassica carinata]
MIFKSGHVPSTHTQTLDYRLSVSSLSLSDMGTKNARDKTNNCAEINSRQHRISSSSSAPPPELMGQSPPQTLVLPNLLSCLFLRLSLPYSLCLK